jgi:hypothetical protein
MEWNGMERYETKRKGTKKGEGRKQEEKEAQDGR